MSFLVRMNAVITQIVRIVFLLQKRGSNVYDGDVIFDSDLKDLNVITFMPVCNILPADYASISLYLSSDKPLEICLRYLAESMGGSESRTGFLPMFFTCSII